MEVHLHSLQFFRTNYSSSSFNLYRFHTSFKNSLDQKTKIPSRLSKKIVKFKTLRSCKLGISMFPDFEYNAEGGYGTGGCGLDEEEGGGGESFVEFDVAALYIPPLTTATTKFLGLPLPPFLRIDIAPELLRGNINSVTGKVDLEFKSKFWFSVGALYRAPALTVETILTTEESRGKVRRGKGERMDGEGRCKLVGVAVVQPINDFFMNSFLSLPTECLATLNAVISWES